MTEIPALQIFNEYDSFLVYSSIRNYLLHGYAVQCSLIHGINTEKCSTCNMKTYALWSC